MIRLLKNKAALGTIAVLAALGASQAAHAQTALGVSATIGSTCLVTTVNMAFGVYDPTSATDLNSTTAGQVQLVCTTGAVPKIDISVGLNAGAGTQRKLKANASDFLNYDVYQPVSTAAGAGCPAVGVGTAWAAGTPFVVTAAPSTAQRNYNVCGRIPKLQSSAVGSYSDTLQATITF
jgi:spore coat protein U-like protein